MKIVGITFKNKGKIYYFNTQGLEVKMDQYIVVETERGLQYGKVVLFPNIDKDDNKEYKPILRLGTNEDYDKFLKNLAEAEEAKTKAIALVKELKLKLVILDASFTLDRSHLYLSFSAEDRVDFRELAKKLAGIFRTRIELRQIGARDKAELIGGVGVCGRELCCSSFLRKIDSVSMNMAKNQNLSLNPTKINGNCGRLLCCLNYENECYSECRKGLPNVGQNIQTEFGVAPVVQVDILKRKVKVWVDGELKEIEYGTCTK